MLLVTVREGDYVMIGENIKVHFDVMRGKEGLTLGIEAPREIEVLRGSLYEKNIAEMAQAGDESARALHQKLREEHIARRKRANQRANRRLAQERRVAAGEIKAHAHT